MIALYALLGLVAGAFLNLCADQLPRYRGLRRAPSCPQCSRSRPPWQWIATIAYLGLKPRCDECGTRISWRHVVVEVGTALLFAFIWQRYHGSLYLLLYSVYSAIFVLVIAIDVEHQLILNVVMFPAWAIALLGSFLHLDEPMFYRRALLGAAAAFVILVIVYLVGELFLRLLIKKRGKPINAAAFGQGDVTLGIFIGLVLGFPPVLLGLILGVVLGGVGGILYWFLRAVIKRDYSPFTAIPYGPFLVTGAMAMMFFGPEITRWWMGG